MLSFPFGTATITGTGDSEFPLTGVFDVALYVLLPTICTSFDHDAGQTTFTGTVTTPGAFVYLEAYSGGTLVTTGSGTDETGILTFTVASATFDTAASTGQAHLTATITELLFGEWGVSTVIPGLDMGLSLDGTTGVAGEIDGSIELLPISTIFSVDSRPFSLTVGAVCF